MSANVGSINSAQPSTELKLQPWLKPSRANNARTIQICQEKYPKDFKRKKILTLAIAIAALALLIIPAAAQGLAALSLCSFGIGLLIVTPIALLVISKLIKNIDDKTQYWSGKLAQIIIKQKEEEAQKALEKAKKKGSR